MDFFHLKTILAVVLACVLVTPAAAQRRAPDIYLGSRSAFGCSTLIFDGTELPVTVTNGRCTVKLGTQVFQGGTCVGNSVDFANGLDFCVDTTFSSVRVDLSGAAGQNMRSCPLIGTPPITPCTSDSDCAGQSVTSICWNGRCAPTALGQMCLHDVLKLPVLGDGTRVFPSARAVESPRLGGDGSDLDFVYNGEGAGSCSGATCRGGTCTGSTPTGTCTLNAAALNSQYGRMFPGSTETNGTATAIILNYTSFSMTAGTLKMPTPASNAGTFLLLRTSDAFSFTGGTIDLRQQGAVGGTVGTCAATASAGKAGGSTLQNGGVGGTSGVTNGAGSGGAGGVGANAKLDQSLLWQPGAFLGGSGAGIDGATTGAATPSNMFPNGYAAAYGATGGGGGGCNSNVATTACSGAAGSTVRAGGGIRIESARSITMNGTAVLDLRGGAGSGNGAAGSAGGSAVFVAPVVTNSLSKDTSTCSTTQKICVAGGAAGTTRTGCGANAAGGNGDFISFTLP